LKGGIAFGGAALFTELSRPCKKNAAVAAYPEEMVEKD